MASGNGAALWPSGCANVEEVPYDLARVIPHAYRVLGWFENMTEEEVPPEWMWPFEDSLESWFANVKANRNAGSSGSDEAVDMTKNELAGVGDRFKR